MSYINYRNRDGYKPAYKKHQVIQALPGYYAVDFIYFEDGSRKVTKEPIIAWLVTIYENHSKECYTVTKPITVDDLSDKYDGAILLPDGSVVIEKDKSWDNLEAYAKWEGASW